MELSKRITRLVRTARDFKYSMPILCYYTQLYTVQQILALKERTEEQTACATQLLDQVETFKQGIPEDDEATRTLVHDQDKAKMYVLSFAMSLYNSMLQQVKDGGASRPLARGLWCCIDLFEIAVDTWKGAEMTLMEQEQCLKKIKFCKYYLAKLAKGEATGVQQGQEEQGQEEQPRVQEEQPQVQEEQPQVQEEQLQQEHGPGHNQQPTTPELDYADFLEGSPPRNLEDEDVDNLLEKMRALDSSNHPKDSPQEESQPSASEAHDTYTNEPPLLPDAPSFSPAHNSPGGGSPAFKNESVDDGPDFAPAPTFVDLDSGDESSGGNVNDHHHHHHHHASQPLEYQDEATSTGENKYTKQDIYELMSRAEAIDKAQRSAKYAISALNYDDIATAREELTQALQALASLEQRGK